MKMLAYIKRFVLIYSTILLIDFSVANALWDKIPLRIHLSNFR